MLFKPVSGPVLILVRNSFLKLLIFQRQPLVLSTVIQLDAAKKGSPQTKGYMSTLLRIFSFQLTMSLLVLPILVTSLELSRMTQKNRFIFSSFSTLKLQPPPKRVILTFLPFYSVSQLKPNPWRLNSKGMVGNFLFLSLSGRVKTEQVVATFTQSQIYIFSGLSIQIRYISLYLLRCSSSASPKALQKYLLLDAKALCFLHRPIFYSLQSFYLTTRKDGQSLRLRNIAYFLHVNKKKITKLSRQATQKESSFASVN